MNPNNYKICIKVNDIDNFWLKYYHLECVNGTPTQREIDRHLYLGYDYTNEENWYYQYNKNDGYYYIVVDK